MSAALEFRDYGSSPLTHRAEIWPQDNVKSINADANVFTPSHKKWTYEEYGAFHLPQHIVTIAIIALVLAIPGTVLGVTHLLVNSSNKLELSGNGASSTPQHKEENASAVAFTTEAIKTPPGLQSYSNESKKSNSIAISSASGNNTLHQCQFPMTQPGETCSFTLAGKLRIFKFAENSKRTGTMNSVFCAATRCQKDIVNFCDTGCVVSLNDLLKDAELSWGKRIFGN
jgi:hypothetical protein